ncbi:MAG: iron-containing redox enzyme family protein [Acidobacteriia bacterium]|nr:iron-containing redox enzyme family protein [Terriglobia bacterium]
MEPQEFWREMERRIAPYDLLCHPLYKAWSAGELTREDLKQYASDYYHHVAAFPTYLSAFNARLSAGPLREAVMANYSDELGVGSPDGRPHDEIWLDFAEGVGAHAAEVRAQQPVQEVRDLIDTFLRIARTASNPEVIAAFWAYESQVPRLAREKYVKLREKYAADDVTCGYFDLHAIADVYHAQTWKRKLGYELRDNPGLEEAALNAAEEAAKALWRALDGIDRKRKQRVAA